MKYFFIVGMQYDNLDENDNNLIQNIIKEINNFDGRIIFLRDSHQDDTIGYQNKIETLRIKKHCIKNSDGWRIQEDILENGLRHGGIKFIDKNNFALDVAEWEEFVQTERYKYHYRFGEEEIYICGTMTDVDIISLALFLRSNYPYTKINLIKNCCKGTYEAAHNAAIKVMENCLIDII